MLTPVPHRGRTKRSLRPSGQATGPFTRPPIRALGPQCKPTQRPSEPYGDSSLPRRFSGGLGGNFSYKSIPSLQSPSRYRFTVWRDYEPGAEVRVAAYCSAKRLICFDLSLFRPQKSKCAMVS